jgi:hypothetical protein
MQSQKKLTIESVEVRAVSIPMRRVSMNRLLGSPIADVGGVRYEYPTTVGLSDEISGTHSV